MRKIRVLLCGCLVVSFLDASAAVLRVPADFPTIQGAVNAARAADTVLVSPGIYNEKVVISTSDVRVVGPGIDSMAPAIVDGTGLVGVGVHARGTSGAPVAFVEVHGLVVRNFERGIVLENAVLSTVRQNETHSNVDKETSVLDLGDGIVLIGSSFNEVIDNSSHDNGHNGIFLTAGSTTNTVRANRIRDNGAQRPNFPGCGIQVGGGANNSNNTIIDNDIPAGHWGILIFPGTNTGNLIARNRVTGHVRAGVAIRATSGSNVAIQNEATGNGTSNITPSFTMDLFDESTGPPNLWERNRGRRALHIPVTGKVPGARNENFVADLRLVNSSGSPKEVSIEFFPSGIAGTTLPATTRTVTVPEQSQGVFDDLLGNLFSTSGTGALRVIADHDMVATSRVLSDRRASNAGTTGLFVPALEIGKACANGTLPMLSNASLADIQNGVGFRTNIGYFNPLPTVVTVTFIARRNDGSTVATKAVAVAGFSHVQNAVFDLFDTVAEANRAQTDFFVTYTAAGGPLFVYAAVVDNKTGDGVYLTGLCNL